MTMERSAVVAGRSRLEAEKVERIAYLTFEDEPPRARSVLERCEPLVHAGFMLSGSAVLIRKRSACQARAREILGVLQMSADGHVEGEVERDVLRHALPSGRRRDRIPPPCERVADMATRALELSFYGRKLNREALRGCPEPK
ncbi:hypothetical protein [Streptomyces lutosisoli]|uniref:Uncharacterized protein n=1 Tax=Streptomyces lutosisoli TaxID=2665721 RepID=A0ABW2W0N9_9ACTN